jgi:putative transposase
MDRVKEIGSRLGVRPTCDAFGVPRASYYRWLRPKDTRGRPGPPRALSSQERGAVLEVLNDERFVDLAPAAVYARLLDAGRYLCSERTMYRILAANAEVKERRNQLRHPVYEKPELLATRPNELWSWDLTKLLGPAKWTYYYLYVILDVFSRYVVGWMVAYREAAILASRLIEASCQGQGIEQSQLTLHADRGSSMKSKTVALLLSDLGVTKSHSRPHVSNDNPYSEAQFKTLKYRPEFPQRFGCLEDARAFCVEFFRWYNMEHYHGGLGLMTPYDVHYGLAEGRRARRAEILAEAYACHPERFVRGMPRPPELPKEVWINKPVGEVENGSTNMTRGTEIVQPGAFMEVVSEAREEIVGVAH